MSLFKLSIAIFFVLLITKNFEQEDLVTGNWDLVSPEYGDFNSLDIDDSLAIPNLYDLDGSIFNDFPRNWKSLKVLPLDRMDYTESYHVSDDTLFVKKDSISYKYVKSDISKCILKHRYTNSFILIDLPSNSNAISFEQIPINSCGNNIYIGKLQQNVRPYFNKLTNRHPDSTFIQTNDVLISINDLVQLSTNIQEMCYPKAPLVYLHIDKKVSNGFVNKIISTLSKSGDLDLNKVVKISNGDIGAVKL